MKQYITQRTFTIARLIRRHSERGRFEGEREKREVEARGRKGVVSREIGRGEDAGFEGAIF